MSFGARGFILLTCIVQVTHCLTYPVPDTNETTYYNDSGVLSSAPSSSSTFYGQDASYITSSPKYVNNGDGTVTDQVTGLMWTRDPGSRVYWADAISNASNIKTGGYTDWRVPTVKELYTLILFSGTDITSETASKTPFIDTSSFVFSYGSSPFRTVDAQYVTSTTYVDANNSVSSTGEKMAQWFGVNFADGRIKGYPKVATSGLASYYVMYVRGTSTIGTNSFTSNGDSTITDSATGLMWMTSDSGFGMNWKSALSYCESLTLAGFSDWRLPDIHQLQSIVDYSRSPGTTKSPAINSMFNSTSITNEAGNSDWPWYWSSTTHAGSDNNGTAGAYIAFGRAMGKYGGTWIDVHGAGAQRSDPKTGSASSWPDGYGPQGDAQRVTNYVRCVRSTANSTSTSFGLTNSISYHVLGTLLGLLLGYLC